MFFSIKRVKFSNFRSFLGTHDTGELPTTGLVLINGRNLDTGGSSGSGKSNFTLAVAYALGYNHIPANKLQCRKTDIPMQVEVVLETDVGEVVVKRGAITSISGPGFDLKGATAVNAKLEEILRFDLAMLKSLTYRPQRKFDFFLSLEDSQKRDFLTALLGLEKLEAVGLKYKLEVDRLVERKAVLESSLLGIQVAHDMFLKNDIHPTIDPAIQIQNLSAKNAKFVLAEQNLGLLKTELQELIKDLTVVYSSLEKEESEINHIIGQYILERRNEINLELKRKTSAIKEKSEIALAERKRLRLLREEYLRGMESLISELNKQLTVIHDAERKASAAAISVSKCDAELLEQERAKNSFSGICPSCEQPTKDNKILEKIRAKVDSINNARANYVQEYAVHFKKTADKHLVEASLALAMPTKDKTPYDEAYQLADKEYATAVSETYAAMQRAQDDALRQRSVIDIDDERLCSFSLSDLLNKKTKVLRLIETYKQLVVSVGHQIEIVRREKNAIAKDILLLVELEEQSTKRKLSAQKRIAEMDELKAEIADTTSKLSLSREVSTIFSRDGFYGLIFEEVVDSMVDYINANAMYFPNIGSYTFGFDMQKVNQKGDSKNRITPYVFDGEKLPLFESISGGQLTSFELLTDFAFYDTVYSRTKRMPGYLILDESFNGHDNKVKEACLDFLKKNSGSRAIYVIDHASEFKEMFDKHIKIVSENGISRLE